MNPELIYIKTRLGESMIQQRTRSIQRNARMILILVDGRSSVADLAVKTGNMQLTEIALVELENGGYIEPLSDMADLPTDSRGRSSDAPDSVAHYSSLGLPTSAKGRSEGRANDPAGPYSETDKVHDVELELSRFSLPPDFGGGGRSSIGKGKERTDNRSVSPWIKSEVPPRPSFLEQLKAMWAGSDRLLKDEPVVSRHARRTDKGWVGRWFRISIGLVVALVVLSAILLRVSLDRFIPRAETTISSVIGQPASIQGLHIEFLPALVLMLEDVRLGQGRESIPVRAVYLYPDLTSLLSEGRRLRKAIVSGVAVDLRQIARVSSLVESLAKSGVSPQIERLGLEKVDLSLGEMAIKNMEAEIDRNERGDMRTLTVRSADKSLILVVEPNGPVVDLKVEAFAWSPGATSKFTVDSLTATGRLEQEILKLSELRLRALAGDINGEGSIRSTGEKQSFSGTFTFEKIDAARLGDVLGIGKKITGTLAGRMQLTAEIGPLPQVLTSVGGTGEFNLVRGGLYGLDLAEAARRLSDRPVQGGMTTFEQISGRLRMGSGKVRIYDLVIDSGLMQSAGYLDFSKGGAMNGRLELRMHGSANQTRLPILISGTLEAPAVQAVDR